MANPNLVSPTTINLVQTDDIAVGAGATTLLTCAANHVYYVMAIRVTNITSGTAGTVNVYRTRSAVDGYLEKLFSVGPTDVNTPANKELPYVLNESDVLKALASAGSVYTAQVTYVDIS